MSVNTPQVKKPDPVDWTYGGASKPLPPGGKDFEYLLKTKNVTIDRTKDGYLMALIDAVVVAPGQPYDGAETRFNRVSTKNWPGRPINAAAEYLKAVGAKVAPQDDPGYEAALRATNGQQFRATMDWEAFSSEYGVNVKGMDSFPRNVKDKEGNLLAPKLPEGSPVPFVMAKKADGTPVKVYANARIRFFRNPAKS